jgi:hypothetical protein
VIEEYASCTGRALIDGGDVRSAVGASGLCHPNLPGLVGDRVGVRGDYTLWHRFVY